MCMHQLLLKTDSDLHKKYAGVCMTQTGTGFNKEDTIIWARKYNLMRRNSNNTSG